MFFMHSTFEILGVSTQAYLVKIKFNKYIDILVFANRVLSREEF